MLHAQFAPHVTRTLRTNREARLSILQDVLHGRTLATKSLSCRAENFLQLLRQGPDNIASVDGRNHVGRHIAVLRLQLQFMKYLLSIRPLPCRSVCVRQSSSGVSVALG